MEASRYNSYIQAQLVERPEYVLSDQEKRELARVGIAAWITGKLLRTNFRRAKLSTETQAFVLERVANCIAAQVPIQIILGFGGYKHFSVTSAPRANWSEFFNLAFLSEWLQPVLATYPKGVHVEYESEDIILELANGYSRDDLDAYSESMLALQELFNAHNPKGLTFSYIRARDQYSPEDLKERMEKLLPTKREELGLLSDAERAERIKRSARNIIPGTAIDALEAKAMNLAFLDADYELRASYFDDPTHVPFVFTFGLDVENVGNWPVLGSTRSSFVDFWVGHGILEDRGDRIINRILSPKQCEQLSGSLAEHTIDVVPLKGFESIEVFTGTL